MQGQRESEIVVRCVVATIVLDLVVVVVVVADVLLIRLGLPARICTSIL